VPLPGTGEPLRLYRCRRAAEGLPFGGQDEVSLRPPLKERLEPVLRPMRAAASRVAALAGKLALRAVALAKVNPRRTAGVSLGVVAVLGLGTFEVMRRSDPVYQARALLERNQPSDALKRLSHVPAEEKKNVAVQQVRARALHALKRHGEEYAALGALDAAVRDSVEDPVLELLAEDFGEDEGDRGLRKLLSSFSKERVTEHFEELAEQEPSAAQWGALRYLEAVQSTDGLNLVKVYTRSLESTNCGTRARAARRLAALGNADAVPALQKLSQQPKDKAVVGSRNCGQDEAEDAIRTLTKKK
jgi:serine/threonine-protein kinase